MRWGQAAEAGAGFNSTRMRSASGIGIAMGWHGAGFTGSGEQRMGSTAGVELGADGVIRLLIANTEIGQGTNTVMPMIVAEVLGVEPAEVELAPIDTSIVPNSGPTVASRTVMVVGGLVSKAAAKLRALVEERSGGTFADVYRADAAAHGATRIDQQYESEVEVAFDDETHTGDAYPAFGWACAVAKVDVDLDTGEVPRALGRLGRRCGAGHPPAAGRGPGRGRHAAGGGLRHHRGDEAAGRALSQRPPGHLHHPHLDGCS